MKVLVLGATGMLGHDIMHIFMEKKGWQVYGTVRTPSSRDFFPDKFADFLVGNYDVENRNDLESLFLRIKPEVVVNCISLSKKILATNDPLKIIPIYAMLPHQLSALCREFNARFIHMSSDGIFSGAKGNYIETDFADSQDIYGRSKYLGEVHSRHAITLRTSIIGHELRGKEGLIEWFLSQKTKCKCFSKAIYSGLPTVVLAQIIRDIIIPRPDLFGVYHIASNPISKCDLLQLVAKVYDKSIEIISDKEVMIDRSLNADRFRFATGYTPPSWLELIKTMHSYQYFL
ncbi:MAG: SDR family oxidoreductase [Deltaproteobacteria bacterium]|nr:MAG: SDR family oxidoreductase [Deltaproteobacteria bacterium]